MKLPNNNKKENKKPVNPELIRENQDKSKDRKKDFLDYGTAPRPPLTGGFK